MDSEIQKLLEERKKLLEMNLQCTIDILKEIYDAEADYTPLQENTVTNNNEQDSIIESEPTKENKEVFSMNEDNIEENLTKSENFSIEEDNKIEENLIDNDVFTMEDKPSKLEYDKEKIYFLLTEEYEYSDEQANMFISKLHDLDNECYTAMIESLPGKFNNLKVGDWSVMKLMNLGYKIPTCYLIISKLKQNYNAVNAKLMEVKK